VLASARDLVDFARHQWPFRSTGRLQLASSRPLAPYLFAKMLPILQRLLFQTCALSCARRKRSFVDELARGTLDVVHAGYCR